MVTLWPMAFPASQLYSDVLAKENKLLQICTV